MARSRADSVANTWSSPSSSAWVAIGNPSATIAKSSMTLLSIASSSLSNSCRCSLMRKAYGQEANARQLPEDQQVTATARPSDAGRRSARGIEADEAISGTTPVT